jgi:phenylalanyl-tRNA synthetase alpha chain
MNNIPSSISDKMGFQLYSEPNHPICIVKERIFDYFSDLARIEIASPYVPIEYNFDRLRVPQNHPSRRATDTYYKDEETVLRTHMTCYLYPLAKNSDSQSQLKYITCGDVYRKDAIDITHYPIFHQIDAFCIVPEGVDVKQDLRNRLTGLVSHLFGNNIRQRVLEDKEIEEIYFPFTVDSLEIEIELPVHPASSSMQFLEILGAGTVHPDIMADLGLKDRQAWAFGLGIERIAMILFGIPDIRLFWSREPRFLQQFEAGKINQFKPFSKYEGCYKDISFFISPEFNYHEMCSIAREEDPNNLIESITLIDEFENNQKRHSQCYRIVYRSMDGTLRNVEVDQIQRAICQRLSQQLKIEIR